LVVVVSSAKYFLGGGGVAPYFLNRYPNGITMGEKKTGEAVHIIPVGFDFQRLAQPITNGELEADRIQLLHSRDPDGAEQAEELAERMADKLEETLGELFGKEVHRKTLDNIFQFEDAYPMSYDMIEAEVEDGNDVWVNISSMPRTIAFAFASAANTLIVENEEYRDKIHTYYVSPDEYLIIRMIEELREEKQFLENIDGDVEGVDDRLDSIKSIVSDIDSSGVTKGAKEMNGSHYVEFPTVPTADLQDFEETVIRFLSNTSGKAESTSNLSRELAGELGEEADQSFQSKVQYNVQKLDEKGFLNRTQVQNRTEIELSTMGRLWVETHQDSSPDKVTA
jgi:hypothetical protein